MFLHPLFLLGLATVAAPVVIHLVFKMRARQVPFPTIRFLKEIDRRVSRRKRLEELLVLFLRCAALLLLTLALTRPVSGGGLGASGTAAVIVLDDSYSMALKDADGTVFARARSLAGSVLRTLGPGDMAQVLTSRRRGDLARDIPALEAEVSKLEVSFGAGTLRPLVEAGLETLARTEAARRELYVVSDFQARASDLAGLDARGANVVLIPVRSSRRENLSITALELASPFATTATPARVRVAIANRGAAAVSRNLRLELDGKRVAEDLVFVPAGGRTTHVETVTLETPGLHVLEAALDEDVLPADDRRLLALDVKQRARVLVIRPDAAGAASRSFYLERALDPGGTAQTGIEVVAVDPTAARDAAIAAAQDPRDTACVFLVECSPDTETAEALGRYVAAGGSLLAVQGAEPIAGGAVELLPGRALAAREGETRALRDLDRHHPIFAPLARGETPLDLGAATFFSVSRVEPREGARVLASFGPGEPAILERSLGLGKVVLVASSLHPDATSFPLKVSFVPFVQSVVEHLAAPATESRLVGDPIVLRVPAEGAPATAKLLRPGAEPIEAKREVASGIASFAFGRADRPGAVTLEWLAPDRIESRAVVTNVDPEEGVLDVLDPARVVPGAPVVASADELGPLVRQLRHGRDLGLAFAIAALAAILLEAFLANRFAFGGRAPLEPALARA